MAKIKTHIGTIITKDGERAVPLHETATTWCAGQRETYDKFTGRRCGVPLSTHRLILSSVKITEETS